jgi:hypothetical protein
MTQAATVDQIGYLFTFPFKDENWKTKFLIGFLLYLAGFIIPFIPWIFVTGYFARMIKIGTKAGEYYLPEWDDWGDLAVQGLRLMVLGFIATLPIFLLFALGYAAMLAPAFFGAFGAETYGDDFSPLLVLSPFIGMAGSFCFIGLSMLLGLLVGVLIPPAMAHMVAEDQFSAAFRVSEWWRIFKANIGGFVVSYILLMGTTFLFTFVFQLMYFTFVLCCVIPFVLSFFSFYMGTFMAAIFGQSYRVGVQNSVQALVGAEPADDAQVAETELEAVEDAEDAETDEGAETGDED